MIDDGETIRLGDVVVTAMATPGHTSGSMSWRWRSCEGRDCAEVLFAASLNPVAAPGWRFAAHPDRERQLRGSFARLRALPCGILLSGHPDQSGGDRKLAALRAGARPNPFRDAGACRAFAGSNESKLDAALRQEQRGG